MAHESHTQMAEQKAAIQVLEAQLKTARANTKKANELFKHECAVREDLEARLQQSGLGVCCSMWQCVAVCCCRVLQCARRPRGTAATVRFGRVLQCVAVCCSVLLPCVAVCAKTSRHRCKSKIWECVAEWCYSALLHCVTACCSVCADLEARMQ